MTNFVNEDSSIISVLAHGASVNLFRPAYIPLWWGSWANPYFLASPPSDETHCSTSMLESPVRS